MLSTLRSEKTAAAALTRPVAICRAKEGLRPVPRAAAVLSTSSWSSVFGGTNGYQPGPCRMPSALLTLDPSSHKQEGTP